MKGLSHIQRFKYRSSWQRRGFDGSTVKGSTEWGAWTSPTFPSKEIASAVRWLRRVFRTKFANDLQDMLFVNSFLEDDPSHTSRPERTHPKTSVFVVEGFRSAILSQNDKWECNSPALKRFGSRKNNSRTSPKASPSSTHATFLWSAPSAVTSLPTLIGVHSESTHCMEFVRNSRLEIS